MGKEKNEDYKPRFGFEISETQQERCNRLFPTHGQRKALMSVVLDDLLDLLEERGQIVAGLIVDKMVRPREVVPVLAEAEKKSKQTSS
jgi:hypothetical protein